MLISICVWIGVDWFFGTPTAKLTVPEEFRVSSSSYTQLHLKPSAYMERPWLGDRSVRKSHMDLFRRDSTSALFRHSLLHGSAGRMFVNCSCIVLNTDHCRDCQQKREQAKEGRRLSSRLARAFNHNSHLWLFGSVIEKKRILGMHCRPFNLHRRHRDVNKSCRFAENRLADASARREGVF